MCTRVLLGKGTCPQSKDEPQAIQEGVAELRSGKSLRELPDLMNALEDCFKCPHYDPASPRPILQYKN
jgi:hypothetical protein